MIRLPADSSVRSSSAGELLRQARTATDAALPPNSTKSPSPVRATQFTRSGIAIIPTDLSAHQKLLEIAPALQQHFRATKVEAQSEAARDEFIIPYAPLSGSLETYRSEIATVFGVDPVSVRAASNKTTTTGTLFVSFPAGKVKPRKSFTLLQWNFSLLSSDRKPRARQCTRCWGFHNVRGCTRPQRCRLCGSREHVETGHDLLSKDPEVLTLKCVNCTGPHAADHSRCPVHPFCAKDGRLTSPSRPERGAARAAQNLLRRRAVAAAAAAGTVDETAEGGGAGGPDGVMEEDSSNTLDPEPHTPAASHPRQ